MKTFGELQSRLAILQGVRFEELAEAHAVEWPENIRAAKGTAGRLVEIVLGMTDPDNRPAADLSDLGLEIKTVPLRHGLRPLEDTKVTSLNYADVCAQTWSRSTVAKKLRAVLFVPVVKPSNDEPGDWYIRSPFIWIPSERALDGFRTDYREIRRFVRRSPGSISSAKPPRGQGNSLTARTAGRNSQDVVDYECEQHVFTEKRRAWFLRRTFVGSVLEENIRYRADA